MNGLNYFFLIGDFTVAIALLVGFFFRSAIEEKLAPKLIKLKSFFLKNDTLYFMSYRFIGGGGTPYAIQNIKSKQFYNLSKENKENQISLVKMQALFFPLMILLIGLSNIFVIYIGGKQYLEGKIESIGIIAEFIIYVNMLTWPVASLGWISSIIQQAEASQKSINEFLKEKSEIINNPKGFKKIIGKIEFSNVSFIYSESKIQALENLSFIINKKESLGLIGVTGSGKTTLLKLITRSFNRDSGNILIDDKNVNEFDIENLRKQFVS